MGSIVALVIGMVIPLVIFIVTDYDRTMKELETFEEPMAKE